MKISIITVCYNAKDTIEETFLSIVNQTYKNVELIVIDGGSTDGTLEVIDKYKENISHFVSETDKGIYDAMNKGIDFVTGDFVSFLNANDTFYDEKVLEKVAETLRENFDAEFLFGDAEYISEDKKTSRIQTYEGITNNFAFLANNICHQSIFYKKSLFDRFGKYSNDYKIYADWAFNIKCLVENKVLAIYLPTAICKFQLGGACSNSKTKNNCKVDKNLLIDSYFNKYKFLIKTNVFFKKNFKWLSSPLSNILINPIIKSYSSQCKYLLNIKTSKLKIS